MESVSRLTPALPYSGSQPGCVAVSSFDQVPATRLHPHPTRARLGVCAAYKGALTGLISHGTPPGE